jgi:hypothetical protein
VENLPDKSNLILLQVYNELERLPERKANAACGTPPTFHSVSELSTYQVTILKGRLDATDGLRTFGTGNLQ